MKAIVLSKTFLKSAAACNKLKSANCSIVTAPTVAGKNFVDWLIEELEDTDAIIIGHDQITKEMIEKSKKLKVIAKQGAGIDNIDIQAATQHGVWVTSTTGANADSVADLTFALILSVSRQLIVAHNLVRAGGWSRIIGAEVWKKNLGIVGFGDIGQRVARRGKGFSMSIAYYDIFQYLEMEDELGVQHMDFEQLLSWADYLTIHVPLSAKTQHLIGSDQIDLMKTTTFLINLSRGGVVDEKALYNALVSGRLAGAGLDVFVDEPIRDLSLVKLPTVVATPHMGAYTDEAIERVSCMVADSIITALAGNVPESAFNKSELMMENTIGS